jgi:hypothetical protein
VAQDQKGAASGPLFLASYRLAGTGQGTPPLEPALAGAAFTYDNALAGIALLACGDAGLRQAHRRRHRARDRAGSRRGRRAGAQCVSRRADDRGKGRAAGPLGRGQEAMDRRCLPGEHGHRQRGVGRAAAAEPERGRAVAELSGERAEAAWLDRAAHARKQHARRLQRRLVRVGQRPAGADLEIDRAQHRHRGDRFAWAARAGGGKNEAERQQARTALDFVARMWSASEQRFYIGTKEDGATIATDGSGLDAQLWPVLAATDQSCAWERALEWVEKHHRFGDGYGFSRNPDGIWTEGSAQVAATLVARKGAAPEALWQLLASQRADNGLYYATPASRISTGLAIGPDSPGADFFYYRWPHLGATAWIALAAMAFNPFTGKTATTGVTPSCPT